MASGEISLISTTTKLAGRILWSSTANSSTNSSSVYIQVQLKRTDTYYTYGTWTGFCTIWNNINDTRIDEIRMGANGNGLHTTVSSSWLTVMSGTYTVPHSGSGYGEIGFAVGINAPSGTAQAGSKIYTSDSNSSASLGTIVKAATLAAAPNFNDEENPSITYWNPSGNNVTSLQICITLDGSNDDVKYRDLPKTGDGNYTFQLTEEERNVLRNATVGSNSRSVGFYLKTVIYGGTYYSKLWKTFTVINSAPTLSPTVIDTGGFSTPLTGDNNIVIKGFNYMVANSGGAAKKGATIASQTITCGEQSVSGASGNFENVESGTFVFTLTDSRGNTVSKTINKTLIPYVPLTCDLAVDPPTTAGDTKLVISGNYFSGTFGAQSNMLEIFYRHKINGGEYGEWVSVPIVVNEDNTYKLTVEVSGLDYTKAHTFQSRAIDKVRTMHSTERKVKTTPVFDWSETDFNFNVPIHYQGKEIDFVVDSGTSGIWSYRKWNSGFAECWGKTYKTINAAALNYSNFYYSNTQEQSFPFEFKEVSYLSAEGGSQSAINFIRSFGGTNSAIRYILITLDPNQTSVGANVNLYACGKWK